MSNGQICWIRQLYCESLSEMRWTWYTVSVRTLNKQVTPMNYHIPDPVHKYTMVYVCALYVMLNFAKSYLGVFSNWPEFILPWCCPSGGSIHIHSEASEPENPTTTAAGLGSMEPVSLVLCILQIEMVSWSGICDNNYWLPFLLMLEVVPLTCIRIEVQKIKVGYYCLRSSQCVVIPCGVNSSANVAAISFIQ